MLLCDSPDPSSTKQALHECPSRIHEPPLVAAGLVSCKSYALAPYAGLNLLMSPVLNGSQPQ
jgi:hypothetical protein